jgi:hypothetical protein
MGDDRAARDAVGMAAQLASAQLAAAPEALDDVIHRLTIALGDAAYHHEALYGDPQLLAQLERAVAAVERATAAATK